jgi:tetratricopeptide (TPR) repeat protein
VVTQLVESGRGAEAEALAGRMSDPHSRAFALIALAKARAPQPGFERFLQDAESVERTVTEPDLVAAGLREIGRAYQQAGQTERAKRLFRDGLRVAETQGESASSTVADLAEELARLGELREARLSAARYCTAGDRLRVYAAIVGR